MDLRMRKLIHGLGGLADISAEVTSSNDIDEIIRASLYTLLGAVAIPKGAIARFSAQPRQLKIIAAKGMTKAVGVRIPINQDDADWLLSRGRVRALKAEPNTMMRLSKANGSLSSLKIDLVVPMVVRNDLMGLILLSEKLSRSNYSDEDMAIIHAMAQHIGAAIYNHRLLVSLKRKADENRRLYREMRSLYENTIRAFASAIDLKDAYTKGHSDRVARYSEAIAREMGMAGLALEQISIAGYLHDIGKIVVDRSIINNPKPLTEREYQELNRHVTTGYEILAKISNPWREIAYMTKCHHEKIDGTGYPQGLRGDEIPLGSRIVTVADSYDAMITDRPYRSRLSLDKALGELKRHTGKQFDPGVVTAFCRLLLKEVNNETRSRVLTSAVDRSFDRQAVSQILGSMITECSAAAAG